MIPSRLLARVSTTIAPALRHRTGFAHAVHMRSKWAGVSVVAYAGLTTAAVVNEPFLAVDDTAF